MNELTTVANVFKDFAQQQIEGCPARFCLFFLKNYNSISLSAHCINKSVVLTTELLP